MPNYGVVTRFCTFKKQETKCPAVFDADSSQPGAFGEHIEACMGKDATCRGFNCKYADGSHDPFAVKA